MNLRIPLDEHQQMEQTKENKLSNYLKIEDLQIHLEPSWGPLHATDTALTTEKPISCL